MLVIDEIQKIANWSEVVKKEWDVYFDMAMTMLEEIIEKVLQGEADIGELRISYLERYFDSYSKNLDLIARKYSSLDETFLILNDRLAENYKKLSSDITNLEKQLKETAKTDRDTEPSDSSDKETRNGNRVHHCRDGNGCSSDAGSQSARGIREARCSCCGSVTPHPIQAPMSRRTSQSPRR